MHNMRLAQDSAAVNDLIACSSTVLLLRAAASYFSKQALSNMKAAYDHYSGQVVQS
jgi:hypothetical protein